MPALLDMNTSPAETELEQRKPAMRFQHASGSRPLDGYTIKRGVGRGGFGEVYFAVSDAGKEVALKLIRRNLEVELRGVTHCLNLKHTNLIDIYDIRTDAQDDRWVVMEYVSGASLEDVIERHPQGMPRDMALHWFEGICAGVGYLHDHGIVHRDLKPANIFLDEGRVKIGDYGLSKFISCSRRSGQTESVGTVHYMAPEIANGRYGREIDAYALGIILYEMLTGHVPFEGESVGEVLMKHLTADPKLDEVEEPYRSVIRGAMAKDPERRINNAAEMVALLRGVPRTPQDDAAYRDASPTPTAHQYTAPQFAGAASPQPAAPSPGGFIPPQSPTPARPSPIAAELREFFFREPEPVWAFVKQKFHAVTTPVLAGEPWTSGRGLLFIGGLVFITLATRAAILLPFITFAVAYGWYWLVRLFVQVVANPPSTPGSARGSASPQGSASAQQWPPIVPPTPPAYATPVSLAPRNDNPSAASPTQPSPAPTSYETRRARRRRQSSWRYAAYAELAAQPLRRRVNTMLTTMLVAGVIAPVAALFACLFTTEEFAPELFLWTAIVCTLAAWAVMIPAQLTEGRVEDQAPLRFTMLLLGLLVGVIACGVATLLYLDLPLLTDFSPRPHDTFSGEVLRWNRRDVDQHYFSIGKSSPGIGNYAAYFACLFVVLRWWRMAEWTRSTRVSLWSIVVVLAVAWAMSLMWWFPQPIGAIAAGVTAFTVQLSSPWLSPSRRKQLAQAALAA